MTNFYVTADCLARLSKMPAVDITDWRYPLELGSRLAVFFPPPFGNQHVVLLPTSPGSASGVCVMGKQRQKFTFSDDGGLVDWGGRQIKRGPVIAPIGTALLAVHLLNTGGAGMAKQQDEAPRQVRKAMKAAGDETGDDYYIITPRTDYVPESGAECRQTGITLRYHLRRGHYRTLRDGRKIWIRACHAGDKSKGTIHKDYRI